MLQNNSDVTYIDKAGSVTLVGSCNKLRACEVKRFAFVFAYTMWVNIYTIFEQYLPEYV